MATKPIPKTAARPAAAPARPAAKPAAKPAAPAAKPKPAAPATSSTNHKAVAGRIGLARRPAAPPAPEPEAEPEATEGDEFDFEDPNAETEEEATEEEATEEATTEEEAPAEEGIEEAGQFDDTEAEAGTEEFDENAETEAGEGEAGGDDDFTTDVDTSGVADEAELRRSSPAVGTYHWQIADVSKNAPKQPTTKDGQTIQGKMGGFTFQCVVMQGRRADGKSVKSEINKTEFVYANMIPRPDADEKNIDFAKRTAQLWSRVLGFTTRKNPKAKVDWSQAVGKQFIAPVVEKLDQNGRPRRQLDTFNIYSLNDPEVRDVPKDKKAMAEAGYAVPKGQGYDDKV